MGVDFWVDLTEIRSSLMAIVYKECKEDVDLPQTKLSVALRLLCQNWASYGIKSPWLSSHPYLRLCGVCLRVGDKEVSPQAIGNLLYHSRDDECGETATN